MTPLGERPCFLPPIGELPGETAVGALFLPRLGFRQHLSYIIDKRIKQYGPTGLKPGTIPSWERPTDMTFQKHAAKVAREAALTPPEKPLKTF